MNEDVKQKERSGGKREQIEKETINITNIGSFSYETLR